MMDEKKRFKFLGKRRGESLPAENVTIVKEKAKYVIIISPNNDAATAMFNPNGCLNVIAVIGPGRSIIGHSFTEAVLLEVGISRTRPYAEAKNTKRGERESVNIPSRQKWFSLTSEQYELVAPLIFRMMQEETDAKVSGRKCNHENPFFIKSLKRFQAYKTSEKKKKCEYRFSGSVIIRPEISFSVDIKDAFLVADMFAIEFDNPDIKAKLRSLGRFIDKHLSILCSDKKRSFEKLVGAKDVFDLVASSKYPHHVLVELLRLYLPNGERNAFYFHLCKMIGWDGESLPFQQKMAQTVLTGARLRAENVQLRFMRHGDTWMMFRMSASMHSIPNLKPF